MRCEGSYMRKLFAALALWLCAWAVLAGPDEYHTKVIRAAKHGDAKAQFSLGEMYYIGDSVPQDYGEAVKWFRKAADQGYAEAQEPQFVSTMGFMYDIGQGVPLRTTPKPRSGTAKQLTRAMRKAKARSAPCTPPATACRRTLSKHTSGPTSPQHGRLTRKRAKGLHSREISWRDQ